MTPRVRCAPCVSGIDDLLQATLGGVESLTLAKGGKANVENSRQVNSSQEGLDALGEESLRQVLIMGRLQYVCNKYLESNSEKAGRLEVEVTLNANGSVKSVVVMNNAFKTPDFEYEIFSVIRRRKAEPIRRGEMRVVYPI